MLLQANNITKSYGTSVVLSNISIQIQERERIGLVGVNGAGKSTLLKILAGEMSCDSGDIYKSKETRLGYLAQHSGFQSERSIWEEMLQVFAPLVEAEKELRELENRMADPVVQADEKLYGEVLNRYSIRSDWFREQGGYGMEARIRSVLHGMGFGEFSPETPVGTLSGGQKTRLALARLLLQAPDLLMLDEPTNYLDIPTLTWLEDYLRGYSGAILVVSHDRYFLDALVQTIVEIERTSSKRYTGNYTRFMEIKAAEYEIQLKHYEKQQDEIAKMEDFIQRNIVRATTTKRAQSRRKALERMDRIDKPLGELKRAAFSFGIARTSGKEVLQAGGLAVSVEGKGRLFENVSFQLTRGETVALTGPNGIGKSTLLKTLIGDRQPDAGTITWGSGVSLGYYDQEQTGLTPSNTVLDELWNDYPHLEEVRIRTVLGTFLFSGEDVLKRISSLSGGEKARVSLAKLMLREANVLILDEPTNHLDLYSKEALESALMDYEGTLLFISHDRYFLNKMAERVIELTPTGMDNYLGNYDDMMEKKADLAAIAEQRAASSLKDGNAGKGVPSASIGGKPGLSAKGGQEDAASDGGAGSAGSGGGAAGGASGYEADKQAKREERQRQRRLEQLEQGIAGLEEQIAELESALASPEVYNDYVKVQEISAEIQAKKNDLEQNFAEWESLL
ncbi:ribosomal protection-like ABC-F family protein [Paenibacillus sp. y28]|uniref:ribosomal protection-like ABC-F family protein n=1 Tax=Paenibacillus sp. y28 TaxID=3129110 RepID=UPI0030175927